MNAGNESVKAGRRTAVSGSNALYRYGDTQKPSTAKDRQSDRLQTPLFAGG